MPFQAYIVTNTVNGKQYVGITTLPLAKRWKRHCGDGQRGVGMAIRKYGKEMFTITHIASATSLDDLLALERLLIVQEATLAPHGYNLCSGGEGQFNPSDETRERLRAGRKGYKATAETLEKMRVAGKERPPPSKETRQKNAEGQHRRKARGTFTPEVIQKLRAHRHTPDTIARMKKAQSNRSPEWRANLSKALTGQIISEERRAKLSKVAKAIPPERRARIAASLTGRKTSAETRLKQSEAQKACWAARKSERAAL